MRRKHREKRSLSIDVDLLEKLEDLRARRRPIPSLSDVVNEVLRAGLACLALGGSGKAVESEATKGQQPPKEEVTEKVRKEESRAVAEESIREEVPEVEATPIHSVNICEDLWRRLGIGNRREISLREFNKLVEERIPNLAPADVRETLIECGYLEPSGNVLIVLKHD